MKNTDKNVACNKAVMAIQDTLDIVGGKWKLLLISVLRHGTYRFNEISKIAGISPRILSKELKELEINGLVERRVCDTRPVTVEYSLTPYSDSLEKVVIAMFEWGLQHRNKIVNESK